MKECFKLGKIYWFLNFLNGAGPPEAICKAQNKKERKQARETFEVI